MPTPPPIWRRRPQHNLGPYTGCRDWEISDNVVYDNFSVNIYLDTDIGHIKVERNLVCCTYRYDATNERNKPDGIRIANEARAASASPPPSDFTIVDNIICGGDCGIRCSSYGPQYVPQGMSGGLIAHNTIVAHAHHPFTHAIWFGYQDAPNREVKIINNIAYAETKDGASIEVGGAGITFAHNFNQGDPGFVRADTHWSAGHVPDPAAFDLIETSPCIDMGAREHSAK